MLFNGAPLDAVKAGPRAAEYQALEQEYDRAFEVRREAAAALAREGTDGGGAAKQAFADADKSVRDVRTRAKTLVASASGASYDDVNYVFPTFVISHMPIGLVGLLIAAIFAAAMSSIAAELNALATATVIDVYKRHLKPVAEDSHYLFVSKLATAIWGVLACTAAVYAVQLGSLIEVVNTFGSYFYGSILGVFILAIGVKRANGHGAFVGLIGGMIVVWAAVTYTKVAFLWLNVLGAVVVTVIGLVVSLATGGPKERR
jgi:Na+/proline symporter